MLYVLVIYLLLDGISMKYRTIYQKKSRILYTTTTGVGYLSYRRHNSDTNVYVGLYVPFKSGDEYEI